MEKMARGQRELKRHQAGQRLSYKEIVLAKCYQCTNGYLDGKIDCRVPDCVNYGSMPYREDRKKARNLLACTKNGVLATERI